MSLGTTLQVKVEIQIDQIDSTSCKTCTVYKKHVRCIVQRAKNRYKSMIANSTKTRRNDYVNVEHIKADECTIMTTLWIVYKTKRLEQLREKVTQAT